jgi:hypothetical protein
VHAIGDAVLVVKHPNQPDLGPDTRRERHPFADGDRLFEPVPTFLEAALVDPERVQIPGQAHKGPNLAIKWWNGVGKISGRIRR